MGSRTRRRAIRFALRFWGYIVFAVVVYAWSTGDPNPMFIIGASVLTIVYGLFGAPMWCMAETRQNLPCRNNANGLLLGCHLRQHKRQRLTLLRERKRWGELARKYWATLGGCAATVSALAATVSALTGAAQLVLKQ